MYCGGSASAAPVYKWMKLVCAPQFRVQSRPGRNLGCCCRVPTRCNVHHVYCGTRQRADVLRGAVALAVMLVGAVGAEESGSEGCAE